MVIQMILTKGEKHGSLVASIAGFDVFIMMTMQEDIALELLNINDDMDIDSLSPKEAYECALICNMAAQNKWFAEKSKLSMDLLEYSAEKGDCYAMYQIGMFAHSSNDFDKARNWFLKAAEKGMDIAQNTVGNIYYFGEGVEVDYREALKWYKLAAEQGQPKAQCNIGICYYYGQGVDVDYDEAFKWYFKSAENGEPNALYNLGTCYMNGQGAEKDMLKALEYYELAAEKGHPGAEAKVSLCAAMLKDKT